MHIGLIGGIGPAATDLYYRGLIDAMKVEGTDLELTIAHADALTLVRNFEARLPEAQAEIFSASPIVSRRPALTLLPSAQLAAIFASSSFSPDHPCR